MGWNSGISVEEEQSHWCMGFVSDRGIGLLTGVCMSEAGLACRRGAVSLVYGLCQR